MKSQCFEMISLKLSQNWLTLVLLKAEKGARGVSLGEGGSGDLYASWKNIFLNLL